jgi:Leucine-rich repeat (LRR) protein
MLFFDTPLQDVIHFLSDQHDIGIALAPSVDGSERVTFDANGPFAALLSHLLHPMHLAYRVEGESLLFAPTDRNAYVKGVRQRAEGERAERDLERRTCRLLEAVGGRLAANELGWIADVELRGASVRDRDAVNVRHFRRLSRLDLSGTAVTDAALGELNELTQLKELAVGGTSITDVGLSHLKTLRQLETLDIADTRVTDDGLQKLADLRSLHTVYVENTSITTEGIVMLRKSGIRIRVFDDRPVWPSRATDKGR